MSLVLAYFSPNELFPTWASYHLQVIALVPAVVLSLLLIATRRGGVQSPQSFLMIGLWFAVVVSTLSKLWFRASLDAFEEFGWVACIYFLVCVNAFSLGRIRLLAWVVCVGGVIAAIQGILAYHTGFLADKLLLERFEEEIGHYRRIRGYGLLSDPNDLAQFLVVSLALLGAFWTKGNTLSNIVRLIVLSVPGAILMYGIYLTGSRGAMFGLAAIAYVAISRRLGRLSSVLLSISFLLVLMAVQFGGGRAVDMHEPSAAGRLMAWGEGISMLKMNPLFGIGYMHFTDYYELTAHNSFVLCFAELGMFGYFFWLALIVTTLLGLQRLTKTPIKTSSDAVLRNSAITFRAALYSFLATGWFLSRTYDVTLYVLLALAASLIYWHNTTNLSVVVPVRRWAPLTVAYQFVSIVAVYASIRARSL
jgi:O-antigen ligase